MWSLDHRAVVFIHCVLFDSDHALPSGTFCCRAFFMIVPMVWNSLLYELQITLSLSCDSFNDFPFCCILEDTASHSAFGDDTFLIGVSIDDDGYKLS